MIADEYDIALGRPERVEALCADLREQFALLPQSMVRESLCALLPLLRKRAGALAAPLFALIEEMLPRTGDPWTLLDGLLTARDDALARGALELGARLAESGLLPVDREAARLLASRLEAEEDRLATEEGLALVARILGGGAAHEAGPDDPWITLLLEEQHAPLRRLAARLLDRGGQPVASGLVERLLGREARAFLEPYLGYTRATHLDLVHLVPAPGRLPPVLPALRRAEAACGPARLRELVAELGWPNVNLGLDVREQVGISIGGSVPVFVSPSEAALLGRLEGVRRVGRAWVVVANGGHPNERRDASGADEAVARFRSYNLNHAALLADILDVAPLTAEKVRRVLGLMDRIVADFTALFSTCTPECAILGDVYRELRTRIVRELESDGSGPQLSAELTRLVQTFEDPHSLGEVRTLHGLKRYLHQEGLRLGFRLVDASRDTTSVVNVLVASSRRDPRRSKPIRYVDFEAEEGAAEDASPIPEPVAVIAEGFARQLLHGHETFPAVSVFCYGNEVHHYLAYGNHPAFLRIDYAPPLQGGMIDLEYFGVSNYELSVHPSPTLDAMRLLFRRLDFDVEIEGTRIHARYDKERALDLAELRDKAAAVARALPYLMDLDWTIGSLSLEREARLEVAEAWAEAFARWGVLPLRLLLTRDRQGIVMAVEPGPMGDREVAWPGKGPYRDRLSVAPPAAFSAQLRSALEELGPDLVPRTDWTVPVVAQLDLERLVLQPLRGAVARGELVSTGDGFHHAPPALFEREQEAMRLAEILGSTDEEVAASAAVARQVASLERALRFRTTGRVNGYEVQQAFLTLRRSRLGLYVLRDGRGIARLALFSRGEVLCRRRGDGHSDWCSNGSIDAGELALRLRRDGYLLGEVSPPGAREDVRGLRELFREPNPATPAAPLVGERLALGLRASPGRAVGPVIFDTEGRAPTECDGRVLVTAALRPEDNTHLYRSAGVVSTGGGILSHAGLIALQFHKPALIVSGRWEREADGSVCLAYSALEYREEAHAFPGLRVLVRRDIREREHRLREGDLVVLDAERGVLRVLGQEPAALDLHEELRSLAVASRRLAAASDEREVLALRGQRLRAGHQLQKLLARLADPVLARHAAHELLAGDLEACELGIIADKARLLSSILDSPRVGPSTRAYLGELAAELRLRHQAALEAASRRIPTSGSLHEVLSLRLDTLRLGRALDGAARPLEACGVGGLRTSGLRAAQLGEIARRRLEELRAERVRHLEEAASEPAGAGRLRHLLRQVEHLDRVLETPPRGRRRLEPLAERVRRADAACRRVHGERRVLAGEHGGFELAPLVGWKAANLAEAARLAGPGLVPPWFVVTDHAFQEVLDLPANLPASGPTAVGPGGAAPLRVAIDATLARPDLDDAEKSARIRALWDGLDLPAILAGEVVAAYRQLGGDPSGADGTPEPPFVAVRSSAREEDAESAARAGEFDTFLFIQGEQAVLEHLKRAWSGLWTERAIHNRGVLGAPEGRVGGGVVVQRIVDSRVSGVVQTVNVAEGDLREIVINAGLGLGEGIVSGTVAADHVGVAKEGNVISGPLRFHYVTADKRERVVFDRRRGVGTVRQECLYHQRLRPALEYVELWELVRTATALEAAYGYPLDIEFGIEGAHLWILQVRPVAAFFAALTETVDRYPLEPRLVPA